MMTQRMYITAAFFILILSVSSSACSHSSSEKILDIKSPHNSSDANIELASQDIKPFDLSAYKLEYPLVWVGRISFDKKASKIEDFHWDFATDNATGKRPDFQPRKYVEVDMMNCAGYLGKAKIYFNDKIEGIVPEWRTIPVEIVSDISAKLNTCSKTTIGEHLESGAFAIAPVIQSRSKISINTTDTKVLFATLPKKIKDWRNSRINTEIWHYPKDDLSTQNDIWTDLDGDGTVDIVDVYGCRDEEHCYDILLMNIAGKWTNIGGVQPL